MQIGYVLASTKDQTLIQHDALNQASCDKIYQDDASIAKTSRNGLSSALEALHEGDSLVVWKLDRLDCSIKDLIEMMGTLKQRGIHLKSLHDNIDTSTPGGHFFFHIMACLAQMERARLITRTQKGLSAARKSGRVGGRQRIMTDLKIKSAKQLLADGVSPKDVAKNLGVSVPTLYRWLPASKRT